MSNVAPDPGESDLVAESGKPRVVFVPDDTRVVRYSELRGHLEEIGNVGLVAQNLGVDPSTISRHLTAAGVPQASGRFERRMGDEIQRLQAVHLDDERQHAMDEQLIDAQQHEIEELRAELESERDQAH